MRLGRGTLKRRGGIFALLLAATITPIFAATPATAVTTKNYSIFFFQSGEGVTGTLKNGVFTQKHLFPMNKEWTAAVADRTSLMLYQVQTGLTQTGTLINGVYTKKHSYTLPGGYALAASCDTVMMYRYMSGKVLTMTLINGALGTRHSTTISSSSGPFESLAASCNTYGLFQKVENGPTDFTAGHLKTGLSSPAGSSSFALVETDMASMTDDSFVLYGPNGLYEGGLTVGTAKGGVLTETKLLGGVPSVQILATSPDTVLMYNKTTGAGYFATLVNGVYTYVGTTTFSSGWELIVAGK
jgi:hypothetical protein